MKITMSVVYKLLDVLLHTIVVCLIIWGSKIYIDKLNIVDRLNAQITTHENQIASYEYLSKYKCWSSELKTTMYTTHPSECSKDKTHKFYGYTFTGSKAVPGRTCAVDPKVIPLGSILIDVVTGQLWIAEDTGNKVKGDHVDLFVGEGTRENVKTVAEFACKRRLFIVIEPQRKTDGGWLKNIMKAYKNKTK